MCLIYLVILASTQVLISLLDRLSDPADLPIMVEQLVSNLRSSADEKPSLRQVTLHISFCFLVGETFSFFSPSPFECAPSSKLTFLFSSPPLVPRPPTTIPQIEAPVQFLQPPQVRHTRAFPGPPGYH